MIAILSLSIPSMIVQTAQVSHSVQESKRDTLCYFQNHRDSLKPVQLQIGHDPYLMQRFFRSACLSNVLSIDVMP